jgi:DNA-binding transcriptional regulator LsrR (DeoR family)
MQEVDIVFAGVGQIEIDDDWRKAGREFLPLLGGRKIGEKKISISCLRQHGVVGDMSYCFFDATGTTRKREWNPFCALGTDWFRAMAAQYPHKRVVFVGGLGKEKALRAALAGQLCNVLITDETAARRLLESEGF